jgi:hypothetical protein
MIFTAVAFVACRSRDNNSPVEDSMRVQETQSHDVESRISVRAYGQTARARSLRASIGPALVPGYHSVRLCRLLQALLGSVAIYRGSVP